MDRKKIKTGMLNAHFNLQRGAALTLAMFGGLLALYMLVPLGDNYGPESPEPVLWFFKSIGCLVIAVVAAVLYWKVMKRKYPNYPLRD